MSDTKKVGVVGCGKICDIYFKNGKVFDDIEITACADLLMERAQEKAQEYDIPKACSVDELMADDNIDIVLNLTIPQAHMEVSMAAIAAGKSVYNEKPLTVTRDEGKTVLNAASEKGVLVGCAPDTFLGGGIQTCIKLINDGWIGRPVAATAFMMCRGHEFWHPAPEFYYKVGGGPMFDMGPYYLTALVSMLGPIENVCAMTDKAQDQRTIYSEPLKGSKITVDVPTHVAGTMKFANGTIGTIITSFDVQSHSMPCIEIYGTEGTISVPDPNGFGGSVKVRRAGQDEFKEMPLSHIYAENSRVIGVADMACALKAGRAHRANGKLAYHILDVMHGFHDANDQAKTIKLESTCDKPEILPLGLMPGQIDK